MEVEKKSDILDWGYIFLVASWFVTAWDLQFLGPLTLNSHRFAAPWATRIYSISMGSPDSPKLGRC